MNTRSHHWTWSWTSVLQVIIVRFILTITCNLTPLLMFQTLSQLNFSPHFFRPIPDYMTSPSDVQTLLDVLCKSRSLVTVDINCYSMSWLLNFTKYMKQRPSWDDSSCSSIKTFPSLYTTAPLSAVVATVRHWFRSWARWNHFTPLQSTSLKLILTLSTHARLKPPSDANFKVFLLRNVSFHRPVSAICPHNSSSSIWNYIYSTVSSC